MKVIRAASYLAAICSGSLFISSAFASPITGTLQVGNGVVAVKGGPASGCVDFYNVLQGCGTAGLFNVDAPSDGTFAAAVGTTNNSIKDLQQTFPLLQFITVPSVNAFFDLPGLTLNPTTVGNCGSMAINDSCSPSNSPFTLVNSSTVDPATGFANAVTVKLDVNLIGYQGSTVGGTTAYHGTFTTQITSVDGGIANISTVLAAIGRGETLSGNTYSATLSPNSPTPEPGSFVMLLSGFGLVGLGFLKKHRNSSRA